MDYGKAGNYFSRGDESFDLEPESALWLEQETGYRAAWLLFGELPTRRGNIEAALGAAFQEGRRVAVEEGIVLLRGLVAPNTGDVETTPAAEASPQRAEEMLTQARDQNPTPAAAGRRAKKHRKA